MPSVGLPTAQAKVVADISDYYEKFVQATAIADKFADAHDKMAAKIKATQDMINAMAQNALNSNQRMMAAWDDQAGKVDKLAAAYENAKASASQMATDSLAASQKMADAWDDQADSLAEVITSYERARSNASAFGATASDAGKRVAESFARANDTVSEFREHVSDGSSEVRGLATDMATLSRNTEAAVASVSKLKAAGGWTPEALAAAARGNAGDAGGGPVRYHSGIAFDAAAGQARALQALQNSTVIPDAIKSWLESRALGTTTSVPVRIASGADTSAAQVRALQGLQDSRVIPDVIKNWLESKAFGGSQGLPALTQSGGLREFPAVQLAETARAVRDIADVAERVTGSSSAAMNGILGPNIARAVQAGINARAVQASNLPGGIWPAAQYGPFGGGGGIVPSHPGGIFGGGGGGGGGGFLGGLLGGAGGLLGGAGGAVTGGGAFSQGASGRMFSSVAGFFKRNWNVIHYAIMGTNEILATLGPATVAAGAAALVGMQGGEQVIPRIQAVFNASESLGDSLGVTAGQAWGIKSSPLQTAQNLATGSAFELTGAGVNIAKAGGGAFAQLGSNTVAMFDRFAASLTKEFQQGMGTKLAGIVSGGTGDLQEFGDVFGNLGHLFMNLAPNLPGVGQDYLATLKGITGGAARLTGFMGGFMGPVLAFEAAARLGTPLVGGAGAVLGKVGLGTTARLAAKADIGKVLNPATGALVATEGEEIAGTGAAGLLGGLGAGTVGLAGLAAFMAAKGYSYKTPEQQRLASIMSNVNQQGIAQGLPAIIAGMQTAAGAQNIPSTGLANAVGQNSAFENWGAGIANTARDVSHGNMGGAWNQLLRSYHGVFQTVGIGGQTPTNTQAAQQAMEGLSETMVNSLGTGKQVQEQWKGLTGTSIGMGAAFDVATMAQLQLGSAFEKGGKLSPQAKTMIANLEAGYQPMQMNTGQYGSAVAAQTATSGLAHSQVAAVNSAFDQISQLTTGGTSTAATLFGLLGGAPVTHKAGGINLSAPPSYGKFANALTSFTSASGSAAWNTFSGSQNSLVSSTEAQLDWLRQAQTMGALGSGQTTGMSGFLLQQLLPMAKKSPAALAQLSNLGQQFGGPQYDTSKSQLQNYKDMASWISKIGDNAKQYNKDMTAGSVAISNIPNDAKQFMQQAGSGVASAMAQGIATHGASLQNAFMGSIVDKGGKAQFGLPQLEKYGKFLAGSGVPKAAAVDMAQYAAKVSGAGPNLQAQVAKMMGNLYAKLKVQADTSQAQQAINALKNKDLKVKVDASGASQLKTLQAQIDALRSKTVRAEAKALGAGAVAALNAEIASLRSKEITITTRMITIGGVAGISVGIPNGVRAPHMQTGGMVPGSGYGDIIPAMLEPGEAIVPRYLVPLISPILAAHKVPGFGGMPQSSASHFAAGGIAGGGDLTQVKAEITAAYKKLDALYAKEDGGTLSGSALAAVKSQISAFWKTVLDPLFAQRDKLEGKGGSSGKTQTASQKAAADVARNFTVSVSGAISKEIKGSTAAKDIATTLVDKLSTEMKYAFGVSNAAMYGSGYDPSGKGSGIFGNMQLGTSSSLTQAQLHSSPKGNVSDYNAYVAAFANDSVNGTPGTQSVQDQMKSYLGTEKSFGTDISKLRKGHLNKAVLSQLIAAGPTQGDQLAQSILGGKGGIKSVNSLWSQIQKASKKLGAQAAMGQYGGHVGDDLKSASQSAKGINININLSKGSGDSLDLTAAQISAIVAKVQAALLKQGKRNTKTGIKLPVKGA